MKEEYFVSEPTTFMYLYPDKKSEVTDELLYGTNVKLMDESYAGFVFCRTEYGYDGYVDVKGLSPKKETATKYVVTSSFCDFYEYPEYRFSPLLTLPRGSIVEGQENNCREQRFRSITFGEKTFFVYANNIKKLSELSSFESEKQKRRQIVRTAFSYLGTPYRWGGKSTYGIDCSGLCFMSYALSGLPLYRDAVFDRRYVRKISFEEMKPADLIYYNGHITMYTGLGGYIHSSATLGGVRQGSFDESSESFYPELAKNIVCCARSIFFE